jgi:hypothetical protein
MGIYTPRLYICGVSLVGGLVGVSLAKNKKGVFIAPLFFVLN